MESLFKDYLELTTSRGVMLVDGQGVVRFVNPRLHELLELGPQGAWLGLAFEAFLEQLITSDKVRLKGSLSLPEALAVLRRREVGKMAVIHTSGAWYTLSGRVMGGGGYALTVTDITPEMVAQDGLKRTNKAVIMALADLAENRDSDTGEHVLRVARITHEMSLELHAAGHFPEVIDTEFIDRVALASVLHDVGKVTIPDRILLKPGRLEPDEMGIMRGHAQSGTHILTKIQDLIAWDSYLPMAAVIAESHHEQVCGKGYPRGLSGEEIPVAGRIVAVADVFDALTSWRPYKNPWPRDKAAAFITENAGVMFDVRVVEAFQQVLEKRRRFSSLTWDETMTVGIGVLDRDHNELINLINQLGSTREAVDPITLEFVVDELYNYTVRHFKREEMAMAEIGFPGLERHRLSHRALTGKVREMRRNFLRDNEIAGELQGLLGSWLYNHILGEDQEYHRHAVASQATVDDQTLMRV